MRFTGKIWEKITESSRDGKKLIAVLLDPDKFKKDSADSLLAACEEHGVDFIFAGGSLITQPGMSGDFIKYLKSRTYLPVVLFPGSPGQVDENADALLLLSLISGRNPELLIGHHVTAAPYLLRSGLEIISTGYILVDGGVSTTVSYISGTQPVPSNKPEIAAVTALAGEMLGNRLIYLDAGSGAISPVSEEMISAVKSTVEVPVVCGGGIRTAKDCQRAFEAGADLVVVGTAIENSLSIIEEMAAVKNRFSLSE